MEKTVLINFATDRGGLVDAIHELERLGVITRKDAEEARKLATTWQQQQRQVSQAAQGTQRNIQQLSQAFRGLSNSVATRAVVNSVEELEAAMQGLSPEVAQVMQQFRSLRDGTLSASEAQEVMRGVVIDLNSELSKLATEGKRDTLAFQSLESMIEGITQEMQAFDQQAARGGRNLQQMREELKKMLLAGQEGSTAFTQLATAIDQGAGSQSARTRLQGLRDELERLDSAGLQNTNRFRELTAQAGALTDQTGDLRQSVNYLASDTRTLDSVMSLGQGLGGAFNAATAAAALLGGENEELQQAFLKTQAALAALSGVQQVANSLNKNSAILEGIRVLQNMALARATDLQASSTARAAVAQRILNLVANANPYVLLATAIFTVVGALAAWQIGSRSMREEQEKVKRQQELNKKIYEETASTLGSQMAIFTELRERWSGLNGDLQAQNKFIKENKEQFEELGYSVENVADAENILTTNSAKFVEAMILRAKALALSNIAAKYYEEGLKNISAAENRDLGTWQKIWTSLLPTKQQTYNARLGILADAKKAGEEQLEQADKAIKQRLQLEADAAKLEEQTGLKRTDKAIQQAIDRSKALEKAERDAAFKLAEIRLKAEQDAFNRVAADRANVLESRLEAVGRASDKEIEIIRLSQKKALSVENLGANQRAAIVAEYAEKEAAALRGRNDRATQLVQEGVAARLEAIKKGAQTAQIVQSEAEVMELLAVSEQYARGIIALEEFEKNKVSIKRKYAMQALEEELDILKTQLQAIGLSAEKRLEIEGQIFAKESELRKRNAQEAIDLNKQVGDAILADQKELSDSIDQLERERIEADMERTAEMIEQKKAVMDELKNQIVGAFTSLVSSVFASQQEALQEQLASLDQYYTTDIEKAKKNSNLKLITEEELEKKKREIKQREATAERNKQAFEATIAAFSAAAKALPNLILSGIVLAVGLANAVKIRSTSVPRYWKGRQGGKAEMALVGEYGPEYVHLPAGSSVIPAHKTRAMRQAADMAGMYKLSNLMPDIKAVSVSNYTNSKAPAAIAIDYKKLGKTIADNIPKQAQISTSADRVTAYLNIVEGNMKQAILDH